MLVSSRKKSEAIVIDRRIRVVVCGIEEGKVRLGIECDSSIDVDREEVHNAKLKEEGKR